MNIKIHTTLLFLFFTIQIALAKENVVEIHATDLKKLDVNIIPNQTGVLVVPTTFLKPIYKKTDKGQQLPSSIAESFDENSSLIIHNIFIKLPNDYDQFTKTALKNKTSIEKNLLYNSKIDLYKDDFIHCQSMNGTISTDINLPKFLQMFDYPERLMCDIKVNNTGTGKKHLTADLRAKLPQDLKDDDVRFLSLDLTNCNMIFKAVTQNIYFVKASDGKTLIISDNFSLVKNSTLSKLDKVKLFMGSPVSFINDQAKKNTSGLLTFVSSSKQVK